MSSRQSVAQRNSCRRSTCAGYERGVASHIFVETVLLENETQQVCRCRMEQDGEVAGVEMFAGQVFYFVASSFQAHRYYIVTRMSGEYVCSSSDERVVARLISKAKAYKALLSAQWQKVA